MILMSNGILYNIATRGKYIKLLKINTSIAKNIEINKGIP